MKKIGVLNRDLSELIASMGHTDRMVVCDGGFPVPEGVKRVDLALKGNFPRLLDVLDVILEELQVEKVIIAEETKAISPARFAEILQRFPNVEVQLLPHVQFKELAKGARGVVRTGDFTPYSNVILVSGVVY